jgi:hypothetical protein
MRAGLGALALVTACVALAACSSKECTLVGCGVPFEVTFQPVGGRWVMPASYEVDVTADGRVSRCVVALPFPSCAGPGPTCTGDPEWQLLTSGCGLPAEQHGIGGIWFGRSRPAKVDVSVTRGDMRLAVGTFTPTYRTSEPNGPGCGDVCVTAPPATLSVEQ